MKYFDKTGTKIKAGMYIRMSDGSIELVYDTVDAFGNPSLGINASNEEYLRRHPEAEREYYSLSNFDMRDVEIIYNVIDDSMKSIRAEARKERRYSVCSFDESIGDSEIIDDQYDTKRLLKKVMKHMKELTDVQQRRLRLYFFENKTFKEIAAIEGGVLEYQR